MLVLKRFLFLLLFFGGVCVGGGGGGMPSYYVCKAYNRNAILHISFNKCIVAVLLFVYCEKEKKCQHLLYNIIWRSIRQMYARYVQFKHDL